MQELRSLLIWMISSGKTLHRIKTFTIIIIIYKYNSDAKNTPNYRVYVASAFHIEIRWIFPLRTISYCNASAFSPHLPLKKKKKTLLTQNYSVEIGTEMSLIKEKITSPGYQETLQHRQAITYTTSVNKRIRYEWIYSISHAKISQMFTCSKKLQSMKM